MFLKCFCFLLLRREVLLSFLGFCVGTFYILLTLLSEVSGVVSFYVCK